MKVKEVLTIIAIILSIIFMLTILVIVFIGASQNSDSYQDQCKKLGYDSYLNQGWEGEFCIGKSNVIQVITDNGKLLPIKK